MGMHDVVWWEIESPDVTATQAFYGALFGWRFRPAFDGPDAELGHPYWIVEQDGRGIGGLQPGPATGTGVRLYVRVADLEGTIASAVDLGAAVERSRIFLGTDDFWFANLRDPLGLSFGLWTAQPPAG